jgi:amino acid adenylation domain-containing protein
MMSISQAQHELLRQLSEGAGRGTTEFPASHAQRRQWLLHQLAPQSSSYAMPLALRLRGPLDTDALQLAIGDLIVRHESLRTTFQARDGRPVQVVHQSGMAHVEFRDSPGKTLDEIVEEIRTAAFRPFDLAQGPLLRVTVWRLDPADQVLLLVAHHIIADGWSVPILLADMAACYRSRRAESGPAPSAGPHIQPADYAAWEASQPPGRLSDDLGYWRAELTGDLPLLELTGKQQDAPAADAPVATVRTVIGGDLADQVSGVAKRHGCTDFTVLLTAFAVLLRRLSGRPDVVVGTPVPGRVRAEMANLVGCFVNTLPVRLRWDDDASVSVASLLAQTQAKVSAALAHQSAPLDLIVAQLHRSRDARRTPVFDVVFTVQDDLQVAGTFGDLAAELIRLEPAAAKFALTCVAERAGGHFAVQWEYRPDILQGAWITAMGSAFTALLAALLADPDRLLDTLDVPELASLPLLATAREQVSDGHASAADEPLAGLEAQIAAVWARVLGTAPAAIGAGDDFFLLGGHSFLAARVAARLSRLLGVDVTVRDIFDHPTVAGLAGWLRDATGQAASAAEAGLVKWQRLPASVTRAPMSFAQERLWFLTQFAPESPTYNIPLLARIEGPLDVDVLHRAVRWLVARHESLRTSFRVENGEVIQWVTAAQEAAPQFTVRDVDGEAAALRVAHEDAFRPFDPGASGALVRLLVARVSAKEHLVAMTVHHLAADGWAVALLVRDLCQTYRAYLAGEAPAEPPLPARYLDYAAWQRAHMAGGTLQSGLSWWQRALAAAPQSLDLPAERPRPRVRRQRGASLPFEAGPELSGRLRDLARDTRSTGFMVLFAAFTAVIGRYSGQDDLLIGTPVAGRADQVTEQLVGLVTNTVVLRARLDGDPTVRELIGRAKDTCLEAFTHADTPFEKLVEHLSPTRDQSRSPLFQVMLALNNAPQPDLRLPGLTCTPVYPDNPTAKFDVVLNLASEDGQVAGVCEYDSDVYDAAMISALLRHLGRMLEAFAADPDARLSGIDLLDSADLAVLAAGQAGAPARYDPQVGLHTLVEQAVDRDPEAVAVLAADGRGSLTYQQLDAAANQVAWRLIERGVRPDDVVALYARRSAGLVSAELGVLKAGAAFLPLDPAWPAARLAAVLAHCGCQTVLADPAATMSTEAAPAGVTVLPLADPAAPASTERPAVILRPAGLAYVVYTSGSTGSPKGVQVEHAAICNNLLWMQQEWALGPADRLLHKTAPAFDVAVKEVFWPLLAGATLVLAARGTEADPQALLGQLRDQSITVTHFVPSMLELILAHAGEGGELGEQLRYVMSGAETLPPATAERFFARSDAVLLHMYGPTETAIAVTGWACRGDQLAGTVPLGGPMPNCSLYVLDRTMRPVPPLVRGELYVSGLPLARGYLGDPAGTAASFLPDPFSARPGQRMYRTGDLARFGPSGLLEFCGRADTQVKVRGFRVELAEVEGTLRSHPGVGQAVVVVIAAGRPEAHLVAYVTGRPGQPPSDGDELREHARRLLPGHMVPAAVTVLDALPLNANGKVDRAALAARPVACDLDGGTTAGHQPPRDDTERQVANVWAEVLGLSRPGVHDDLFAVGGHSLQAARIVTRLRELTGRDVALREFFAEPTVAAMARLLAAAPAVLPPITRRSGRASDARS